MRKRVWLFLSLATLFLGGCIHEQMTQQTSVSPTTTPASQGGERGELVIEDLATGVGEEVRNGDRVRVHYVGRLPDGTVFDNSYDRKEPFSFVVGKGAVIRGWDIGILGMRLNGKRRLTVPPQFGYGEKGVPGAIPPNATLIFEVELLAVNPQE